MNKIIKRVRKPSPNPLKYLRLHRNENGQKYKSKLDLDRYYPDVLGAIQKLKDYFNIKKNTSIILGLGAESIIKDIFIWHSNKHKKKNILIYDPNYYMYEHYAKLFNYKITKFKLLKDSNFYLNSTDIISAIKKNKINLLSLINPSAPVEKKIKHNELLKIINFCKNNYITIILDEVYLNFSSSSSIKYLTKLSNLIIVKSFTKMAGYPGIRAGFAICNKKIFDELDSYRLSIELPSQTILKIIKILNKPKLIINNENNIQKVITYSKKELIKKGYKVYNKNINSLIFEINNHKLKNQIVIKFQKNNILVNSDFKLDLKNCISFTATHMFNVKTLINLLDKNK